MTDPFYSDSASAASRLTTPIVPNDSTDLTVIPKAIYVGTGGNITLVAVDAPVDAAPVTFKNVPAGSTLQVRPRRVLATGTTAADILAFTAAVSIAPSPASFAKKPSIISDSGATAGMSFQALDGIILNGSVTARRWLLDGTLIGNATTVSPRSAGSLVLENTATGLDGKTITSTSAAVTVADYQAPNLPVAPIIKSLTANPTTKTIAANVVSGTLLFAIGNVPAGVTPTVSPNDGRFAIAGDATSGWKVVVGLSALSAGSVNVGVNAAGATGVSVPVTITSAVAAFAPVSLRTASDLSVRLASTAVTPFAAGTGVTEAKEILIDSGTLFQPWLAGGAALTDASATVLMAMPQDKLTAFLTAVFHPTLGLGWNLVRLCMGDSDYTSRNPNGGDTGGALTGNFSVYDNSDTNDNLASFSTAQDDVAVFPILRQILAINPNVDFLVAPWTPPKFFKNPAVLAGGGTNQFYQNTPANNALYAQYHVKYQQDLKAKVGKYARWASLQNEPNINPGTYPGCRFSPSDLLTVGIAVRSGFDAGNIPTILTSGDVSWGDDVSGGMSFTAYPFQQGSTAFGAAAWHFYGTQAANNPSVQTVMAPYTDKATLMMSEACDVSNNLPASWLKFMGDVVMGSRAYGAGVICFWNLALDPNGQPGTADNLMPVANIASDGSWTFTQQFYALAHLTSYTKPGARRFAATSFGAFGRSGTDVQVIGHKNSDGSLSLDLLNASSTTQNVTLKDQQAGNKVSRISLAPLEMRSVNWKNDAAVVVPDAQAFQVVPATSTSVKVNVIAPVAANGGSPITGYDIWAGTVQGGAKTKIASNVPSGYEITGLTAGNPIYVNTYPRNAAGPATTSVEQSATPVAIAHALNFTGVQNADVYGVPTASTSSASGIRVIKARLNYQSYAAGSGGTMTLAAQGKSSGLTKSETEWLLGSYDTTATPLVFGYNAAGTYKSAAATGFSWTAAPYKVAVINGSANAFSTPFKVGGSTVNGVNSGGAALSIPAGSTGFFESLDDITYTQIGNLVTTWGTGGINNLGAASRAPAIGSLDTNTANKPPVGQFYRLTVTDGTNTLYDIDFTTQAPGAGPYPASVGGNWTIYPTSGSGISVS
ncbi:hypothetical protein [Sphingomonas sp. BAUL-RG-20F-R05-02]|uniref:spike base protein, RCAP_Rcc01079 family n=1 Tax=Sphingomonas sp. BAUL-RG-20F-R05-02 TaxID=2914830 RepID=UPI001F59E544|nr:hypothetical protein [Sphingomonas sp. BAUL-RG-20F-R05-02]